MKCKICGGECGIVCKGLGLDRPIRSAAGHANGRLQETNGLMRPRDSGSRPKRPYAEPSESSAGRDKSVLAVCISASDAELRNDGVQSPSKLVRKRGRPRLEDAASTLEATRPWDALGMSRRTWYRRQKEGK